VPAAEVRMQPYSQQRTTGNLFGLLGVATLAAGGAATIAAFAGEQRQSGKWVAAGFALDGVAIISFIVAASYRAKSRRTLLESVNLYNQAVEDRHRCPPAQPPQLLE
jgi:hypothetical protein